MSDVTRNEIRRLVRLLGTRPNAIAESLVNKGIKGHIGIEDQCPLAVFLKGELGDADEVEVHGDRVQVIWWDPTGGRNDREVIAHLPGYAQAFIDRFDSGRYPELEEGVDPDWAALMNRGIGRLARANSAG